MTQSLIFVVDIYPSYPTSYLMQMMDGGKIKCFLLYQNTPHVSCVIDGFSAVYVMLMIVLLKC